MVRTKNAYINYFEITINTGSKMLN